MLSYCIESYVQWKQVTQYNQDKEERTMLNVPIFLGKVKPALAVQIEDVSTSKNHNPRKTK